MTVSELSPIASSIKELIGNTSDDKTKEEEPSTLLKQIWVAQNKEFNKARDVALFTKGLQVSSYFVDSEMCPGYAGTYLS